MGSLSVDHHIDHHIDQTPLPPTPPTPDRRHLGADPWDDGTIPAFTQALITKWPGQAGSYPVIQRTLKQLMDDGVNPIEIREGFDAWVKAAESGAETKYFGKPETWLNGRKWLARPPLPPRQQSALIAANHALFQEWANDSRESNPEWQQIEG